MIKHIFFDIGGVLINIHPKRCIEYWADCADISINTIENTFSDEVHHSYEKGDLNDNQFFTAFKNDLPQPCCLKESDFWRGWQKILGRETKVSNIMKLLSSDYKIWLLSNTNPRHIFNEIELRYQFPNYIDGAIYSFDANSRKPDKKIYDFALKTANANVAESLFIDDLEENIMAAQSAGWRSIHYKNFEQFKEKLSLYSILT